jgi:hypothetical protein
MGCETGTHLLSEFGISGAGTSVEESLSHPEILAINIAL